MPSPAGRDSTAIVPPRVARQTDASIVPHYGPPSGVTVAGVERLTSVGGGDPEASPQTGLLATLW